MKPITSIEIDGITYNRRIENIPGECEGCAGDGVKHLCNLLPDCSGTVYACIWEADDGGREQVNSKAEGDEG